MQNQQHDINNIESEAATLGSMNFSIDAIEIVKNILTSDDFSLPEHKTLYKSILDVYDKYGKVDLVLLRSHLTSIDALKSVGGLDYIIKIAESSPTSANAEYYAKIVKDFSVRRQMAEIGKNLMRRCINTDGASPEQIRIEAIKDLEENVDFKRNDFTLLEDAFNSIEFGKVADYIETDFYDLDRMIIGLGKGHVFIVAGRPGMGKSSFMSECATRIARSQKKVLFFSLEMTAEDIALRMACSRSGVDLREAIRGKWLTDLHKQELNLARDEIKNLKISFNCNSTSISNLKNLIISAARMGKADIAFIDYLGLIAPDDHKKSRYESTTNISNTLKQIAMTAEIPLVVGCQLNRANESRLEKRPMLSDLRDSGAIEQDADIVMFVHRPAYYESEKEKKYHEEYCEGIIAKNRRGSCGTINLSFHSHCTRFDDWPLSESYLL